ncbi:HNH endonuclease [Aliarcobacter butzleri]|uniref:HNH endonuclease n=1 Tax=Aliarcobacter butzleri TaxID=28197 RepID=UPI003B211D6A
MPLIMPKQDATLETLNTVLDIYYNHRPNYLDNSDFKIEFKQRMGLPDSADGAMIVKKPEIARYFGLIDNDNYQGHHQKITDRGIRYYEAVLNNDKIEIIFESLENDSFGKNNCAIQSSDSLIDPPKLFLKAIYELEKINVKEFSYLLFATHDEGLSLVDSINNILSSRDGRFNFPGNIPLKYKDSKFTAYFESIGILEKEGVNYKIPSIIYNQYGNRISEMSIYNEENVFTQLEQNEDNNNILDIRINNPELLLNLNNRIPEIEERTPQIRYKTNNRIKRTCLENAEYKCTFNINHETFINKENTPFVEAHHLIPMSMQTRFTQNLDRLENLISLCPNCHRQIHYGNEESRFELLESFYNQRIQSLQEAGFSLTLEELKSFYR